MLCRNSLIFARLTHLFDLPIVPFLLILQGIQLLGYIFEATATLAELVDNTYPFLLFCHLFKAHTALIAMLFLNGAPPIRYTAADVVTTRSPVHLALTKPIADVGVFNLSDSGEHHQHDLVDHVVHVKPLIDAVNFGAFLVHNRHITELLAEK